MGHCVLIGISQPKGDRGAFIIIKGICQKILYSIFTQYYNFDNLNISEVLYHW
jgi:hypothetical protein